MALTGWRAAEALPAGGTSHAHAACKKPESRAKPTHLHDVFERSPIVQTVQPTQKEQDDQVQSSNLFLVSSTGKSGSSALVQVDVSRGGVRWRVWSCRLREGVACGFFFLGPEKEAKRAEGGSERYHGLPPPSGHPPFPTKLSLTGAVFPAWASRGRAAG